MSKLSITTEEATEHLNRMYSNCDCEKRPEECIFCMMALDKATKDMNRVETIKYDLE